jgi:hypothetical protein
LKRNGRSGGYKRLGVGVEAKQPILAPRSHAAGRQGAARTPPAVRGATDEHSRQRSASAETTRTLAQEQESIRDLVKCGQTSINSTLARRQFRRDRPSGPIPVRARAAATRDQSCYPNRRQETSTNHLISQQERIRRGDPGGDGSRLNRSVKRTSLSTPLFGLAVLLTSSTGSWSRDVSLEGEEFAA